MPHCWQRDEWGLGKEIAAENVDEARAALTDLLNAQRRMADPSEPR
jgi:hypothetical protein